MHRHNKVDLTFHNLGAILRRAGILDKRPAFEPSRVSLLFVKAFPGGTPMAWPRKRGFSIDPPPTTTIWARPGAEASPDWASAPGEEVGDSVVVESSVPLILEDLGEELDKERHREVTNGLLKPDTEALIPPLFY